MIISFSCNKAVLFLLYNAITDIERCSFKQRHFIDIRYYCAKNVDLDISYIDGITNCKKTCSRIRSQHAKKL
jgi:hypothetical protein